MAYLLLPSLAGSATPLTRTVRNSLARALQRVADLAKENNLVGGRRGLSSGLGRSKRAAAPDDEEQDCRATTMKLGSEARNEPMAMLPVFHCATSSNFSSPAIGAMITSFASDWTTVLNAAPRRTQPPGRASYREKGTSCIP
jgi:hypothetical protein